VNWSIIIIDLLNLNVTTFSVFYRFFTIFQIFMWLLTYYELCVFWNIDILHNHKLKTHRPRLIICQFTLSLSINNTKLELLVVHFDILLYNSKTTTHAIATSSTHPLQCATRHLQQHNKVVPTHLSIFFVFVYLTPLKSIQKMLTSQQYQPDKNLVSKTTIKVENQSFIKL